MSDQQLRWRGRIVGGILGLILVIIGIVMNIQKREFSIYIFEGVGLLFIAFLIHDWWQRSHQRDR
jgi:hypothetical protein